jgi:muramidase (phage lysozyme)
MSILSTLIPYLSNENVAAFLKTIKYSEGISQSEIGYRTYFTGLHFTDLSQHPNVLHYAKGFPPSDAAGAYQFLYDTWQNTIQRALNLPDFGIRSQDIGAIYLVKLNGALDMTVQGQIRTAIRRTNRTWASFPGSTYGQPTQKLVTLLNQYKKYGGTLNQEDFLSLKNSQTVVSPVPKSIEISRAEFTEIENRYEQTVEGFIEQHNINWTSNDLINYKDNGIRILKSYNTAQAFQFNKKVSGSLIGLGARVLVPFNKLISQSIYTINQTIVKNNNYNVFIESEIRQLLDNPKYQRVNENQSIDVSVGSLLKKAERYTVWVWCKSISPDGCRIFDLSPFLDTVNTTNTIDGANFTITLPHIMYKRDKNNNYVLKLDEYPYQNLSAPNFIAKTIMSHPQDLNTKEYKAKFTDDNNEISNNQSGYLRRNESIFHNLIQSNDVVFIKLENFISDDNVNEIELRDEFFTLPSDILAGKIFDLIGLVDTIPLSTQAENSDQQSIMSGRCLSKLIIDDGVYFFPVEYAVQDREKIIKNSSQIRSSNRLFFTSGNFKFLGNNSEMVSDNEFVLFKTYTIAEWLIFIFSQLTNIDIAPSGLFNGYDDKSFIVSRNGDLSAENPTFKYQTIQAPGIWQIVKLVLDKEICDRKITDTSLATDTGSLLNLINKVCQRPFVEFFMDTYGDKFYFIARKPPFSYQSFKSNFCLNVFEHDVISETLTYATDEVYSWYKINPFFNVFGYDENSGFMSIFPGVMLPEYVKIWGNKVYEVSSNFIDFDMSDSEQTESNFEAIKKQAYEDMDWLLETTACLPFTRKGTITLKSDRRFKRGMNIRYFPTDELFYIEAVSQMRTNGFVANGLTTLTVSHGMKEKYLEKYFQIVNLRKNNNNTEAWSVNKDIFDFFLKRLQADE